MKKIRISVAVLFLCLMALPFLSFARDVDPIVSTAWLEQNLNNSRLVIIDVRKVEDYKTGHVPNAVNAFYGSWAIMKGGYATSFLRKMISST